MEDLGFKELSPENWQEPDPMLSDYWQEPDPFLGGYVESGQIDLGAARQLSATSWPQFFTSPLLSEEVPAEVIKLFGIARGAMLYGYYFYPLLILGVEQSFRVVETAVRERCKQAQIPVLDAKGQEKKFASLIQDLVEHGVIAAEHKEIWNALRKARNAASHPKAQQIFPPLSAVALIIGSATLINGLFKQT